MEPTNAPNDAPALRSDVPLGTEVEGLPDPLVIRQLYLGCLSQAAYVVGDRSSGRAIAVDPRRDVDEVVQAAAVDHLSIELVVQTHVHADFLSGHLELAAATGAAIAYGSEATTEFETRLLDDGETIDLGEVTVEVLHTPGHTPESITLVVSVAGAPVAALTGDTLFIGDVGRPDLLASAGTSATELGQHLHRSLQRLMELPDEVLVLPAHGAGSACGKSLSTETVSTIGEQRRSNYALAPMSTERFVELVTQDQPAAPAYFAEAVRLNKADRELLDEHEPVPELDAAQMDAARAAGATLVDVRPVEDFAGGHIAGSLDVGLGGRFAEQVGSVVPAGTPIVLVGPVESAAEARLRLARVGFDQVVGVFADLAAYLVANPERAGRLSRLSAEGFVERRDALGDDLQVIDVRNPGEVAAAPIGGARNIPLARLRAELDSLDATRPVVLFCAGGARSAIANSVLASEGFRDVSDVLGGAGALGVTPGCALGDA